MEDSDVSSHSTCSGASNSHCNGKTGTRGDPRMHRAVAARLSNSEISLFEALIVGGFVFECDDATQVDESNVTLGQRKNQLSRRLRLSRHKMHQSHEQSFRYGDEKSSKIQRKCKPKKKYSSVKKSECRLSRTTSDNQYAERSVNSSPPSSITGQDSSDSCIRPNCGTLVDETCDPSGDNSLNLLVSSQKSNAINVDKIFSSMFASDIGTKDISGLVKALGVLSSALLSCHEKVQQISGIDKLKLNYSREELAIGLYQADNRALYQRAMLLAGYQSDLVLSETTSLDYLRFAVSCWLSEGKRLQNALEQQTKRHDNPKPSQVMPPDSDFNRELNEKSVNDHCVMDIRENDVAGSTILLSPKTGCLDALTDGLDEFSADALAVANHESRCALASGRHVHRLEGKCGHKAILHIPENGPAHIDFVVGDKVECYQGVQPLSCQNALGRAIWPSAYNCDDLSCAGLCSEEMVMNHNAPESYPLAVDPKVFHLDEIDVESNEWNLEFPLDESLLGLFKLGDSSVE
jgi:hypothetical protein